MHGSSLIGKLRRSHPISCPFDLNTAPAAGVVRNLISAFAARGRVDDFRFHLLGDADALEQAREVDAALAFFRPGDGIRGEERALERPRRADVGATTAFYDADANARASYWSAGARVHLTLFDQVVDRGGGEYGEVEGFARPDPALQCGGEAKADDELVSRVPLEGGRELVQRFPHAVRGEDLDFSGAERGSGRQHGKTDDRGKQRFHFEPSRAHPTPAFPGRT